MKGRTDMEINFSRKLSHYMDGSDLDELKLVLNKVSNAHLIGTLYQVLDKREEIVTVKQDVCEEKSQIEINGMNSEFMYFKIDAKSGDSKKMQLLFDNMMARGNARFNEGKENDYLVDIKLQKWEEETEKFYEIVCTRPLTIADYGEGGMRILAFVDDVFVRSGSIPREEIEYEQMTRNNEAYE